LGGVFLLVVFFGLRFFGHSHLFVPEDFVKAEALDAAVLMRFVDDHQKGKAIDDAVLWQVLADLAQNMRLKCVWLEGRSAEWTKATSKKEKGR
jgi:hypothetical protein